MCEYSPEIDPIIVTSHDKGVQRGISIYFGTNELKQLNNQGIDLKNNHRFLVKTTTDNRLVLIPFSQLDVMLDMQNTEDQLDRLLNLDKDELMEFGSELLEIITEKQVEISSSEDYSIRQIMRGHYTRHNMRNAIRVGLKVNKIDTQDLIRNYI